jgi:hypothetical protein
VIFIAADAMISAGAARIIAAPVIWIAGIHTPAMKNAGVFRGFYS